MKAADIFLCVVAGIVATPFAGLALFIILFTVASVINR